MSDPRREAILSAALTVFARFGYRRTSMDEVARAAGLSRQGLYLHFATKEALFTETVSHLLEGSLGAGKRLLLEKGPLEDRLVAAFDAIYGAHVGGGGLGGSPHLAELLETARQLVGDAVKEQERSFRDAVAKALVAEGVVERTKDSGLTAKELAAVLDAIASGLKHTVTSRDELSRGLRLGVRAVCRIPRPTARKTR